MGTQPRAAQHAGAFAAPSPVRIVRADALEATPWKNGGGVTREIAAYPMGASLDTFVWRVSVAEVEQPGPFSRFPGIDRTLVLLGGAGMRLLQGDDATHVLTKPLSVARFDGETALEAQLVDGATRDFNLMVRRDCASATLEVWQGTGQHRLDADAALVLCARGSLAVRIEPAPHNREGAVPVPAMQVALSAMDTLLLDAPRAVACDVTGDGAALAVLVRYA